MKQISFKTSKANQELIEKIVERAIPENDKERRMNCMMDITATHCNGNPMDLKKLMKADDFNFFHDIYGIQNTLNRSTGKLRKGFLPRCSAHQ